MIHQYTFPNHILYTNNWFGHITMRVISFNKKKEKKVIMYPPHSDRPHTPTANFKLIKTQKYR